MDTQHATHARDETQANDSSQADAIEPATLASDQDEIAYQAAIQAAKDYSKNDLDKYKREVSWHNSKALIEQLPFVRKVNVVTKVKGVRKVKSVLKYWAPTYKPKGRTYNDNEAAFGVGIHYGKLLMLALREGAFELSVQFVIREAYAAYKKQRQHYHSTLVAGFIFQIENATMAGMKAPRVIL